MAQTLIEKVLAGRSTDDVAPGNVVWVDLDVRSARDFGGANVVGNLRREYPGEQVDDTGKTFFTFDCVVPAKNIPYANNQHVCRIFAREQGIPVFDVDAGIGSHVMIEQGLARPGATIIGTDSHLNLLGAVCAFGQGMGDTDVAFGFRTGKTWFEVPPTMKVEITGRYEFPTTPKDLTLKIVGELGSKGALGRAIEFVGPAIDDLGLEGRITLASMATEMGAIIATIPPNDEVLEFCRQRSGDPKLEPLAADPDATYVETRVIDVEGLRPQVAAPYRPDNVQSIDEVAGEPVDSIFVGSCTNGRVGDFESALRVLEGRSPAAGVMVRMVPATREVYGEMLARGLVEKLYKTGAVLSNPGCGGCASGQIGMTGEGEVQVSTSNRNFRGKQGAGRTYLASPVVAAAAAVAGRLIDPAELL